MNEANLRTSNPLGWRVCQQMLTSKQIPRDSRIFDDMKRTDREETYFEYVAGKEKTKEALELCKRERALARVSFHIPVKA